MKKLKQMDYREKLTKKYQILQTWSDHMELGRLPYDWAFLVWHIHEQGDDVTVFNNNLWNPGSSISFLSVYERLKGDFDLFASRYIKDISI